jgi:hypothetical protein
MMMRGGPVTVSILHIITKLSALRRVQLCSTYIRVPNTMVPYHRDTIPSLDTNQNYLSLSTFYLEIHLSMYVCLSLSLSLSTNK